MKENATEILYLILPAYNEAANIASVIRDWYPVVEAHDGGGRSRLVIIDDGSRDDTAAIVRREAETRPYLTLLTKENGGHGDTIYFGYRYALQNGADRIFQTDTDGQTLSSEFESFWEARNEADLLAGYRKGREDGAGRVFATKVLKAILFLIFHVSLADANVPYRLMKREDLADILPLLPEGYHLTNVFLSVAYARTGRSVCYLPITFRPRQGGVNSINFKRLFGIGLRSIREFRAFHKVLKQTRS